MAWYQIGGTNICKKALEMSKFYSAIYLPPNLSPMLYKCLICNEEFQNLRRWKKHILNMHPVNNYINLILKNYEAHYKKDGFAWKILRELILKRDNNTCQECNKILGIHKFSGKYRNQNLSNFPTLEIHHKKYTNVKNEDLISLCTKHHIKRLKGKKNG